MYTVYKHTNTINGKIYIGITKQIPKRRWMNGLGYQTQPVFYNAITKYGWNSFKSEILESNIPSIKEANNREQFYIKKYHSYINDSECNGYNMTIGGDTNQTEKLWTDEEDEIIQKFYPIEGSNVCLRLKNRSKRSVFSRAFNLGVGHIPKNWSREEDQRLRETYPVEGIACFSKFPGRTKHAVHKRATQLNLNHFIKVEWDENEIKLVTKYYPVEGQKMLWRLAKKSIHQLHDFVFKNKIHYDNNGWSKEEVNLLKEFYPKMGIKVSNILERSPMSILQKASDLKIKSETKAKILEENSGTIFNDLEEASYITGIPKNVIKRCCSGKQKNTSKYYFKYLGNKREIIWTTEEDSILRKHYPIEGSNAFKRLPNKTITACKRRITLLNISTIRQVVCIELNKTFFSIKDAEKQTDIKGSNINSVCRKKSKTAGGFHWSYADDAENLERLKKFIGKDKNLFSKKVRCKELNLIFNSSAEAERELKVSCVSECCKGHRKKAGGYTFEYVN